MDQTPTRSKFIRLLYIAVALYLLAGGLETALIYAKAHDIISTEAAAAAKKAVIVLSTMSTVVLLRWIIADTPFKFLRKYTVAPLLKSIISLLIYFGAVIVLLNRLFDINIKPILTGSAVLTGVLALSLQETMKNLFTGLWINSERIVAKGDWVKIGDKEGRILDVTWRTTRLLTRENNCIYLPNRMLAEGVLENCSHPTSLHALELALGTSYHDRPNKVREILLDIAANTGYVLGKPEPEVLIANFGEYSINYKVRVWIEVSQEMLPIVRNELYTKIWYAFRRSSIEIPFPVRVAYNRTEKAGSGDDDILYALKNVELLSPLREDELNRVSAFSRFELFGAGEQIVRQGDSGDTCYLIRSGRVSVVLRNEDGGERFIADLRPGEFFGEMSLLAGEPRTATVIAREDTSCLVIASQAFQSVIAENPDLAEKLSDLLAMRSGELEELRNMEVSGKEKIEAERTAKKNILNKIKRFFKVV